jgi:hypothetical protein
MERASCLRRKRDYAAHKAILRTTFLPGVGPSGCNFLCVSVFIPIPKKHLSSILRRMLLKCFFGIKNTHAEKVAKRVVLHERGSGVWPPPISKENPDSQKSSPIKLLILKQCSFASSFVSLWTFFPVFWSSVSPILALDFPPPLSSFSFFLSLFPVLSAPPSAVLPPPPFLHLVY